MEPMPQFYSEQEAEQILRSAAKKSGTSTEISRDRLLQMAAEAGIDAEYVLSAEMELSTIREDGQIEEEYRQKMRSSYLAEVSSSAGVMAVCTAIWLFTSGWNSYFWPMWVLLGLLIGLGSAFAPQMLPQTAVYQAGLEKYKASRRSKKSPNERSPDIRSLLEDYVAVDAQNKIGAIKLVRERTGLGLREAKQEVDAYYLNVGLD